MEDMVLNNQMSKKCAATCARHHCSLTVRQLKGRQCLQKQCKHFAKIEEHPYWRQREMIKNRRKQRKINLQSQNWSLQPIDNQAKPVYNGI